MSHPNQSHRKACNRPRPRRIQKKIDKRFGLLHCDRGAVYIHMVSDAMKPMMAGLVASHIARIDLDQEMLDIITDATARVKETADG